MLSSEPIRILLVEDNDMNRDMLSRRLQRRGVAVDAAIDGSQAIEQARRQRPDLILMDMSLPVMDGYAATAALKGDPEMAAIPVIALTAHAMTGDRERCLEAGCDDYATKPANFPELVGKIEQLLGRDLR